MKWLYDYKRLNKAILYLILAIFCEQIVNAIQTLALNLYLKELGYTDPPNCQPYLVPFCGGFNFCGAVWVVY
jgi:hypothetical protein